jgi:thymidylate kinase
MTLHPLLQRLFEKWDRSEVVWAVLRAPLDPARPEGDIDILLESRTAWAAEHIAHSVGFVTVPGRRDDLHLVRFHHDTGRWLWLHCTTELAFGPFRAVRPGYENRWLASRRIGEGIAVLAPGDEFWITLMHALLDKGTISDRSRARLEATAEHACADGPLPESLERVLPASWTPAMLVERAREGRWDAIAQLGPALQTTARARRPTLLSRALDAATRTVAGVKGVRRRRGVSVALLGPDGAGKSTLATGLERSFVFPVRQVYMGLTGGWLRRVDKLRIPGLVRVGRFLVIWGRYLLGLYHTHRGRLVVFDRYIYDAEVPTPYPLGRLGRLARWLDGRACPGPDLVLVLDAPGAVMHQRKGEYTAEMLEEWRQRFLALRGRIPNVEVLDTTQPPDVVRADATAAIWRRYAERWGHR